MKRFLDTHDIKSCFVPVDTQTAANTGDWISLKDWKHLTIIFFKAAGVANDDPVFELLQATSAAGAGSKDFHGIVEVDYMQGAALTAVTGWSVATQAADEHYTCNATSAEQQGIYVVDIDADQLDLDGGFCYVAFNVADTGAAGAQLGAALYILSEPRYAGDPTNAINPLA